MQLWKDFTFKTKNLIKLKVRKNTIEKVSTQKSGKIKKKKPKKTGSSVTMATSLHDTTP